MEVGDKEHLHVTPGTMPKTSAMCRYSIRRSPPVVIRWGDRNGRVVMNCRSPLSCPQLLRIFLVSIASLPFSIFPLFSSTRSDGRVAEWLNVPDSKSGDRAIGPWVRIPPLPPPKSATRAQLQATGFFLNNRKKRMCSLLGPVIVRLKIALFALSSPVIDFS